MGHGMVGNGCRYHAARLKAEPAPRLNAKLVAAAALPGGGAKPSVNVRRVRHLLNS
jgi:hypothetical protein